MANRYESSFLIPNSKKIESNGDLKIVRRLSTPMYPTFETIDDTKIVAQEGDRLDLLAAEYYGDETLWFIIARANGLGKGSVSVPSGMIIRIPFFNDVSGIGSLINSFNEDR